MKKEIKTKKELKALKCGWIPGTEIFLIKAILYGASAIVCLIGGVYITYKLGEQAFINYELYINLVEKGTEAIIVEIKDVQNNEALPFKTLTELLDLFEILKLGPEEQERYLKDLHLQLSKYLKENKTLNELEIKKLNQVMNTIEKIKMDKTETINLMKSIIQRSSKKSNGFIE